MPGSMSSSSHSASILALSFLPRSSWPKRPDAAARKKLRSGTPGISTGAWKERNSPARERLFGESSDMSEPSKRIDPAVCSYEGSPMIKRPRVDLPAPLGPMRTCVSPLPIDRLTPCKICMSSADAARLRTSSSAVFWAPGLAREVYTCAAPGVSMGFAAIAAVPGVSMDCMAPAFLAAAPSAIRRSVFKS